MKDRALHDEQIMQNYFVANLVYDNLHFKLFFFGVKSFLVVFL
jgi:hypothetical protein